MAGLSSLDVLFILTAFIVQIALLAFFALRKWAFHTALRIGWIVYALSIPAALVSLALLVGGMPWYFWLSGFLFLALAALGYTVEYRLHIEWRSPPRWSVFVPYVTLYLAMLMFYWWPLAALLRPLWYVYAVLFVISTVLNTTSHRQPTGHDTQQRSGTG